MHDAFICHAPPDADTARDLASWLELNTPCRIYLSECGAGCPHDLIEAADQAMSADAVVLLLSPAVVPEKWVRSRWEPVLMGQPAAGGAALACLVLSGCKFPDLLRRRDCFDDSLAGRRALKRWLLARFPSVVSLPPGDAAGGAPPEVEDLRCRLADSPGVAVDVPRDLALAFARSCKRDFEGVLWIDATRRTDAGIAGDLAHSLGLSLEGPPEECLERLRAFCSARRLLIVFDNCSAAVSGMAGRCSVLGTAAHAGPAPLALADLARVFAAWTVSPEPCLAAMRDLPAAVEAHPWSEVRAMVSSAVALLRGRGRAAELLELVEFLIPRASAAGDSSALRHFEWERSWIVQAWGRSGPVAAPMLAPAPGDQLTLPFPVG